MSSGVLILSFVIIVVVIALTVIVTIKAYSVQGKQTIDPLPPEKNDTDKHNDK